jgi:hypothetical protein
MAIVLDLGRRANCASPILVGEDRDANSPDEPGIEAALAHRQDASRRAQNRQ